MADQYDTENLVENYDQQIRDYNSGEAPQDVVDVSFVLTKMERDSALWSKVCKKLDEILNSMRENNDNRMNYLDTIELRGKIGMVKEFRGWGEDPVLDKELPDAPEDDLGY